MKIFYNATRYMPNSVLSKDLFGFIFETKILQQSTGKYGYRNLIVIGGLALLFCSYLLTVFFFLHSEESDRLDKLQTLWGYVIRDIKLL